MLYFVRLLETYYKLFMPQFVHRWAIAEICDLPQSIQGLNHSYFSYWIGGLRLVLGAFSLSTGVSIAWVSLTCGQQSASHL